jgi:hypothetical protein
VVFHRNRVESHYISAFPILNHTQWNRMHRHKAGRSLHFHLRDGGAFALKIPLPYTHTRSSSGAIRVSSLAPQACRAPVFYTLVVHSRALCKSCAGSLADAHAAAYIIIFHKKAERRSAKPTGWEGAVRRIWICTLLCAQLHVCIYVRRAMLLLHFINTHIRCC